MKNLVSRIYFCTTKTGINFPELVNSACATGYNGISSIYTNKDISLKEVKRAQHSGLVVLLWTPYTWAELEETFELHPNIIQTDNLLAKEDLNVFKR
jgi:hypothetical protein